MMRLLQNLPLFIIKDCEDLNWIPYFETGGIIKEKPHVSSGFSLRLLPASFVYDILCCYL